VVMAVEIVIRLAVKQILIRQRVSSGRLRRTGDVG